jgi:ribosome-associated toxin RatA of RatAB toxin-antitoxin module
VADRTSSSITIAATPKQILDVVADFEAYPEWAGVKDVQILDEGDGDRALKVRMSIDAGLVKDTYTLAYEWAEDGVEWVLVEGTLQKAQQGSYRCIPEGGVTRVDYELSIDLAMPMPGMLKRKGEKVIVDTALKGLKKRVEGLS